MKTRIVENPIGSLIIGTGNPAVGRNTSPIFRLHGDILLEIFRINANMDEDPPLPNALEEKQPAAERTPRAIDITRNSSQVTSLWRDLIVNSPTIWADLLDLYVLESAGGCWRDEVIRRTQTSSLHVKGYISLKSLDNLEPWWLGFFNNNWARIRKFDLVIKTGVKEAGWFAEYIVLDYAKAAKYRQALPFLAQPTSTLESFRIVFPYFCDPLELGSTLFDGHAPLLRSFQGQSVRFNIQATWMFQLRSLHVHEYNGLSFTSADALCQILSQMPLLEYLSIEDAIESTPAIDVRREPIHLPQLRYLNIRGMCPRGLEMSNTSPYWTLLNNVNPRHDCSVRAVLSIPLSYDIDVPALTQYAKNYFKAYAPTYLEVSADIEKFRLTDLRVPEQTFLEAPIIPAPFFDYNFYHPELSTQITLSDIFEALFFISCPSVVELLLQIGHSKRSSFSNPQLGKLLSSFSSTEKLTTTPWTLQLLCRSPLTINISTLFPRLKVLKVPLGNPEADHEISIPISDLLMSFLRRRKEAGLPVSMFEYHCTSIYEKMVDLTALESITGLKVVWESNLIGSGEYICGSGRPEELNFANKWALADETRKSQRLTRPLGGQIIGKSEVVPTRKK